jgi:hypothetical protein
MKKSKDGPAAHDAHTKDQETGDQPGAETAAVLPSEDEVKRFLDLSEKECPAFYRMLLTITTLFLGGTLGFVEKIVPHPVWWSFFFLGAGWLCLCFTIFAVVWIRRYNIETLHAYLRDHNYDKCDELQTRGRRLMFWGGNSLAAGILLVTIFGFVNFVVDRTVDPLKESEDARVSSTARIDTRSTAARTDGHEPAEGRSTSAHAPTDISGPSSSSTTIPAAQEVKVKP